jgi:hypothetical protein
MLAIRDPQSVQLVHGSTLPWGHSRPLPPEPRLPRPSRARAAVVAGAASS